MTQEEIRQHIKTILHSELLISLATSNRDTPWACVLEFVCDEEFNIYWKSLDTTRHSHNVAANPHAAATIILPLTAEQRGIGLQIGGAVSRVEESRYSELEAKLDIKRVKRLSKEMKKIEAPRHWYKLTPTEIYLLHEPLLGYERVRWQPAGNKTSTVHK